MSRFQEIGVDRQYEARTPGEARRCKKRSCKLCCTRPGLRPHCEDCQIATAHEIVMDLKWGIKVEKEQG